MHSSCDVIIPSKNSPWWLALCLEELFRNVEPGELGQVLVVDDTSTPDAWAVIERICARHPGVRLLRNTGRPGFGGACNFGVRNSSAPFLLFLNTDCLITRGTIRKLVGACAHDAAIGLACPLSNNSPCLTLPLLPGRSYLEMNALLERCAANFPPAENALEACTVVGNCLLITRACWDKTGEFASQWGQGFGEESDYQMRALDHGFRGVALLDTYVYHFGNGTFRYEPGANALREKNHALFMSIWGEKYRRLHALQADRDPVNAVARRLAALPSQPLTPQILFLLPDVAQGIGGVHAVVDLCNHLLRHGIDAKYAVLGLLNQERLKAYSEPIFAGFLHFPDEHAFLYQTQVNPAAVAATLYSTMPPCFVYAAMKRIHAVYFVQGYECLFDNGIHYNTVVDTYGMASHLVTTSDWLKSRIAEHLPAKPVTVMPIGIDLDLFTPKAEPRAAGAKPRVCMVLRDSADKGQWILLDVLAELSRQRGEIELTVLAARKYAPPGEWTRENCRWLTLPLDRAVIAAELSACDMLVDASLHEGFGLLPLEAMACGATVVVSDSGGINGYVRHGTNGLIVPELNRPDKYLAAIRSLVRDPAQLVRFQAEALKTAAGYSASERYADYEAFVRELLTTPAPESAWTAAARMFCDSSELAVRDHQIRLLTEERARIYNGLSFRIGRILTLPLRALFKKP
jgi:GT2 family glycosyltransferase/glycosyltransferase involved in cell wall biosynthesis